MHKLQPMRWSHLKQQLKNRPGRIPRRNRSKRLHQCCVRCSAGRTGSRGTSITRMFVTPHDIRYYVGRLSNSIAKAPTVPRMRGPKTPSMNSPGHPRSHEDRRTVRCGVNARRAQGRAHRWARRSIGPGCAERRKPPRRATGILATEPTRRRLVRDRQRQRQRAILAGTVDRLSAHNRQ
jgi:hypothetical protein